MTDNEADHDSYENIDAAEDKLLMWFWQQSDEGNDQDEEVFQMKNWDHQSVEAAFHSSALHVKKEMKDINISD